MSELVELMTVQVYSRRGSEEGAVGGLAVLIVGGRCACARIRRETA